MKSVTIIKKSSPVSALLTNILIVAALVIFIGVVVLVGYYAYRAAETLGEAGNIMDIGHPNLVQATATQGSSAIAPIKITPTIPALPPAPKVWDGASRVTVLVMGLDYTDVSSPDRSGPPRTDSMILLSLDPLNMEVSVLNIPRDLWVNIPGGYGYGKINTAYSIGEGNRLPNGGPGLAAKTVEQLLGVPINYYAQIDFYAFEKFIDELDGITVDIKAPIDIDPIGKNNTITLQPGLQTLTGAEALAYARVRENAGDDFGRAERQQEVIISIRRRLVKLWPKLLPKAPQIYADLSNGIHTNLNLEDAIQLGLLAIKVDPNDPTKFKRALIGPPDMVNFANSPDGLDVLVPVPSKIRELRDQLFTSVSAISPDAQQGDVPALVKAENARLVVLNGSSSSGLAQRTATYLADQGCTIANQGNAGQLLTNTTITIYTGKPYTIKYLVALMKINPNSIRLKYDPNSQVDIQISVGNDWAASNKIP